MPLSERNVVLVGRPNVGKSRLFNRLIGRRMSIVHDMPGVTRDIVSAEVKQGGFTLMDTGGIGMKPAMTPTQIHDATEEQVDFAIQAASLILFICDGREGWTPIDATLAERLRHYGKQTLLLVNKLDTPEVDGLADDFFTAGLGEPLPISAEHGRGIEPVLQAIENSLGPVEPDDIHEQPESKRIGIALVGRPNVGKSSLGNRLLNSSRLIVSDVAGTTRDAIESDLDWPAPDGGEPWRFRLVDTAGLRARKKVDSVVEYFSSLRSTGAMEATDVVFLVIDALEGITKFEKKVAGDAYEVGRGLVLVVNKWDYAIETFEREPLRGYDNIDQFKKSFIKAVRKELFFAIEAPMIFTSAKDNVGVEDILKSARDLYERMHRSLPTGPLNKLVHNLIERNPPKLMHGKRFKVYYTVQTGTAPYTLRVYCNRGAMLDDSYKRYLINGLVREFSLFGCPVKFDIVGKPKRYKDAP